MSVRTYRAVAYVSVEEIDGAAVPDADAVKEYCASAVTLDVNTEEHGNPCGIGRVMIDWRSLEIIPTEEVGPL